MQITKEVNPHPCIVPCVNMWSVTFFFFFFFCHLLNVGVCVRHITQEGQVEWTTLVYVTKERIQNDLTSPLCYSIVSHATLILQYHASMLTLQNSVTSRALWLPQVRYYGVQGVSRFWYFPKPVPCICGPTGVQGKKERIGVVILLAFRRVPY